MVIASTTLFWVLFCQPLDGKALIPHGMIVKFRMSLLKPGMEQDKVKSVLGIERYLTSVGGTLHCWDHSYSLPGEYSFSLFYVLGEDQKIRLHSAHLYHGKDEVQRVEAPRSNIKKVDPKLVQAAIDAIMGRDKDPKKK